MQPWRCTSQTECYSNLDVDNRFSWHLRDSGPTTSKCGKIGMIIYLF
ncbi:hypothetical protein Goshw_028319 [Gossypium schwendimanii]|uniref:Uncharacterized protein n=1 Tax=Gossypium schwendimanii TaxID=34291 RepID=A0A7J9N0W9_GOSSC|nr:hypothetical protein [Gossypium schwendimanii]